MSYETTLIASEVAARAGDDASVSGAKTARTTDLMSHFCGAEPFARHALGYFARRVGELWVAGVDRRC
jgi:hypothetical protein